MALSSAGARLCDADRGRRGPPVHGAYHARWVTRGLVAATYAPADPCARATHGRRERETSMAAAVSARRKRHTQVLLGGILPIDRQRIPVDVIAGATLAALAIPEVMGYAKIAGTPVITGLYTLLLPVALFEIGRASCRERVWLLGDGMARGR